MMQRSVVDLTVLMPALNEAENLKAILPRLRAVLKGLKLRCEILVVDGGSSDGTRAAAEALGARVVMQVKPGYGRALREGTLAAFGDYVLMMDADGSHPPEAIAALWTARSGHDLVIASRYVAGGSSRMPLVRSWLSRVLNWITFNLWRLPVRDASSGFKLYKASALKSLEWESVDFSAHQEILKLLLERGVRVSEIPYRFERRLSGRSKAPLLSLPFSYWKLWRKIGQK